MKTFLGSLGLSLALAMLLLASPARAQDYGQDNIDDQTGATADASAPAAPASDGSVSFQQFYDQLSGYGTWLKTDKYGYVFQPTESDPDWSPYMQGHWVNTDAGMTWVGDEPFSWATDHYGRWANIEGTGWVWVPGYTWAPAWVSWRQGDDDVGWAPLPPDSDYGIDYYDSEYPYDYGYHIGDDCDLAYGIGPWCYNFCPIAFIGDFDCRRHFHHRGDNFGLIGRTRNVTNLNFHRGDGRGRFGSVHAGGPSVAALNARSHTPIQTARLSRASTLDNAGLRGNTLSVFAPRVNPGTRSTAHPGNVSGMVVNTRINHGTDINHGLAVNSHLGATSATAAQIHAGDAVRTTSLANARVATNSTHFTRSFGGSLNTLRSEPSMVRSFNTSQFRSMPSGGAFTPRVSEGRGFSMVNPGRTTRVFNDSAASPGFRTFGNAPTYSSHSFAPTYRSYSAPSFHSYGGSSFSTPHFNGGGFSHSSGGGFGGGAHFGGGGFSGGGGRGGGGGFSGGGGRGGGGGGGHR